MNDTDKTKDEKDKKISDLHDQGASLRQIAREVGVSKSEVHRRIKKLESADDGQDADGVPPARELVRPPTSKPGPAAKPILDQVALMQAGESLEALERSRKMREREQQIELEERQAGVRQQNIDSMKAEIELLATKSRLQGSAPEDRQALQDAQKQIGELQRKLDLAQLERSFDEKLAAALKGAQVGRSSYDLLSELADKGLPLLGQEMMGIRSDLRNATSALHKVLWAKEHPGQPPPAPKGPITPEEAAAIAEKMSADLDNPPAQVADFHCTCGARLEIPAYLLGRRFGEIPLDLMLRCRNPHCGRNYELPRLLYPHEFEPPPPPPERPGEYPEGGVGGYRQ